MKIIKRLFLVLFIFFILLIAIAVAIPIIYKDEMRDVVKEQIRANIDAKADFAEVEMSLFSSFPHLSIALNDFSLVGVGQFEGVPLIKAAKAGVTVNVMSVINSNGPLNIRSVEMLKPEINILVLADGSANYDITKATEEATAEVEEATTTDMVIALQSYSIENGQITYDDRSGDIYLSITDLNHRGKGDFTLTQYDLDTETSIKSMTVRQGGVHFLKEAELDLSAIFNIDSENSIYVLKDNKLRVNALEMLVDGQLQMTDEDMIMDFQFNAPSNDFRALWSLIPSAYTADFDQVDIAGQFRLEGLVKGTYNETTYPAFRLKTKVENGRVKYPDLPLAIGDIQAVLDINSPTSDLDKMIVDLSSLKLNIGDDPFSAKLKISTPISDPNVDANMDGTIDLTKWMKAFPVDGMDQLAGIIDANVTIKTKMSTIEREAYQDVKMSGDIAVTDLRYASADLPLVQINKAVVQFTPSYVKIDKFEAKLGKSDIAANGQIDNILAYISPEKTMKGVFVAHSDYFFIDEWMTETEEPAPAPALVSSAASTEEVVFDRFDIELDATADKIVYETYTLTNATMKGRVRPNLVNVDHLSTDLGESDFSGDGTIINGFRYVFKNDVLGGDFNIHSSYFDLNPFMEEGETTSASTAGTEEGYGVIPIPANIDMVIRGQFDKIHYTDMDMNNVKAKLTIKDGAIAMEEGTAKTLGGTMGFTGLYDTKNIDEPTYNFKFNLKKMDFGESFAAFNSFQSFAPIGKLVSGNFSTDLIMSGTLGDDMMPLLETVNAEGLFETLDGTISGVKPLTAIGNALDVSALKENLKIENLKTWFTIKDGAFEVKPFDVTLADLPMTIAGSHSLTQEMNYTINTVIPRSMLGNGALGSVVNKGVSALVKQAGSLGLNVNNAENLNVQISLKGSSDDPKVGFKLLGTDGETSVVESVKEDVKEAVKEQVDEIKEEVTAQVNTVVDSVKNRATEEAERFRKEAEEKAKRETDRLKQLAEEKTKIQADSLLKANGLDDAADKLKDKLKKFNPFGGGGE